MAKAAKTPQKTPAKSPVSKTTPKKTPMKAKPGTPNSAKKMAKTPKSETKISQMPKSIKESNPSKSPTKNKRRRNQKGKKSNNAPVPFRHMLETTSSVSVVVPHSAPSVKDVLLQVLDNVEAEEIGIHRQTRGTLQVTASDNALSDIEGALPIECESFDLNTVVFKTIADTNLDIIASGINEELPGVLSTVVIARKLFKVTFSSPEKASAAISNSSFIKGNPLFPIGYWRNYKKVSATKRKADDSDDETPKKRMKALSGDGSPSKAQKRRRRSKSKQEKGDSPQNKKQMNKKGNKSSLNLNGHGEESPKKMQKNMKGKKSPENKAGGKKGGKVLKKKPAAKKEWQVKKTTSK